MVCRLILVALTSLVLTACGSSSNNNTAAPSNDDPQETQALSTVSGRVIDAVNSTPLVDVLVTVNNGRTEMTARTDVGGNYQIPGVPVSSDAAVTFALAGFLSEDYGNLGLAADTTTVLNSVSLVSDDNFGFGTVSGTITDATTGNGISDLRLNFRRGINAVTGDIIATTVTDQNGGYITPDVEYGNITCEIIGVGFNTSYATIVALGNMLRSDQNTAVSPDLNAGELRIVLTWGASPSDLDSHLTGPQEGTDEFFHVDFVNQNSTLAGLDIDDTSSFGPETVTVQRQINGIYRYTVYNFSDNGDDALSASQARVQVLGENGLIQEFFVPNGSGNLWTVFDLQGGTITPLNTITQRAATSDHFPPVARKTSAASLSMDTVQQYK